MGRRQKLRTIWVGSGAFVAGLNTVGLESPPLSEPQCPQLSHKADDIYAHELWPARSRCSINSTHSAKGWSALMRTLEKNGMLSLQEAHLFLKLNDHQLGELGLKKGCLSRAEICPPEAPVV